MDLAIKFGSSEISVYKKGIGIVAKEPAFLAVIEKGKNLKVQAVGKDAEELFHNPFFRKGVDNWTPERKSEVMDNVRNNRRWFERK